MAKYEKYAEYQDSGVEWLGDIPNNWQVKKLKYLCKVTTGNKDTVNAVEDGKYPFFVRSQTVERINSVGADCEAVLTAGDGVGVGKVYHYYKGKFDFHQRVYMLYDFGAVTGRFVYYYLSSNFYKVALEGNAKSTVDSLRLPQFLNFEFSLPTIKEQDWIVDFLDHETAKIDSLIAKQEKLIELLKEKRQAVISHAVTKGLNPDVTMKDSGVEWLGQVPDLWGIVNIQRVLNSIEQGSSPVAQNQAPQDDEYGVLKISAVKKGNFISSESKTLDFKSQLEEKYKIRKGDLLVTRANTPLLVADACVVKEEPKSPTMMCDLVYRLNTTSDVINEFLCYWLLSNSGRTQIELDARGSSMTMAKVSQGHIKAWKVVLPTIEEQKEIVHYLDTRLTEIDNLINKAKLAIEIIKERRTALISSAVTGKIDVRNWQKPQEASAV